MWTRLPKARRPQNWDSIDDPVVPLERNLNGHPLAALLWETKYEKTYIQGGWEQSGDGTAYIFFCQFMLTT